MSYKVAIIVHEQLCMFDVARFYRCLDRLAKRWQGANRLEMTRLGGAHPSFQGQKYSERVRIEMTHICVLVVG